jgi:hypothetical protein
MIDERKKRMLDHMLEIEENLKKVISAYEALGYLTKDFEKKFPEITNLKPEHQDEAVAKVIGKRNFARIKKAGKKFVKLFSN